MLLSFPFALFLNGLLSSVPSAIYAFSSLYFGTYVNFPFSVYSLPCKGGNQSVGQGAGGRFTG